MKKRKTKQRRNNLLEVLSILKEGTAEDVKNILEKDTLNVEEKKLLITNLKKLEKNNLLTKPIKIALAKKATQFQSIQDEQFELILTDAIKTKEEEEETAKSYREDEPFRRYMSAVGRAFQPVTAREKDFLEIGVPEPSKKYYQDQKNIKARMITKDYFLNQFLPNVPTNVYEDYENYKNGVVEGAGSLYNEYLEEFVNNLVRIKTGEVKEKLGRTDIPLIPAGQVRHIPQMVIPQEPPTSPASVLGQIGTIFKKGLQGFRTATGLEEELIRQESLQESLQLKKLSLKEAMEKEYD